MPRTKKKSADTIARERAEKRKQKRSEEHEDRLANMAPKINHGSLLIIDIGKKVCEPEEKHSKSFFENARECVARLIERKIMSQDSNLIGVILMGSDKTKNNMAVECPGSFKNIELFVSLQEPTWQMIRDLPTTPTQKKSSWLDALIVAADHFKNEAPGKIENKKIILMTNFKTRANLDAQEMILDGFKQDGFEVDVIGPDLYDEKLKSADIALARRFVEETHGATAPFYYTMRYLLFHKKKVTKPSPWNVDLSIGPNIRIPVSTYIRLEDKPPIKSWQTAVKDPVTGTASSKEGIMKTKEYVNTENQDKVQADSVTKGYHYGQEIIPFTDNDKAMLYKSGDKCLSVYGFTNASNVSWQNFSEDGLHYLFARKGDKKAEIAIRCLVECLHEKKLVGIVRKVYSKGNNPKMFALMPVIDTANNIVCLSLANLCFKDEIKNMAFPSTNLKKFSCNEDQVEAFKELIKAMDLTKAYDETYEDTEAFPIAETVSPTVQYVLDCIAYRAMHPNEPLPQPRDDVMSLFKIPPLIEKRSREPLEKLKKLFPLNKIEPKTRKPKANYPTNQVTNDNDVKPSTSQTNAQNIDDSEMPKIIMPVTDTTVKIEKIGTIDPVSDFKLLIENGKTLNDLAPEMTAAIEDLIIHNFNLDGKYTKVMDAMAFYRAECVKSEPSLYNKWWEKFRFVLNDRKKKNVIELIHENKLGFIIKEENPDSNYEQDEKPDESQAYEEDTILASAELSIKPEVDDLFDEL